MERVREFIKLDREVTEEFLKLKYLEVVGAPADTQNPNLEEEWRKVWNDQILGLRIGGTSKGVVTFGAVLAEDSVAFELEALKLAGVTALAMSLVKVFQGVMTYLAFSVVSGNASYLTGLQVGLVLSLIISLLLFIFHSHQRAELTLLGSGTLPEVVKDRFADRVDRLSRGGPLHPIRVTAAKGYLGTIRDHFGWLLAGITTINTVAALLAVAIALVVGAAWRPPSLRDLIVWYERFAFGLILIPIALLGGYYVTFWILRNARIFMAAVITGGLGIALPYALTYFVTGRLDLGQATNAIAAAAGGILPTTVAVITSKIRKDMEGGENKHAISDPGE